VRVVDTIITELAVIHVTKDGLVLDEIAPGITADDVQRVTAARLSVSPALSVFSS